MDAQNPNTDVPFAEAVAAPIVAPAPATTVQDDLAKIELALLNLAAAGEALFADEIAALKQKRDTLLAKVQAAEAEAQATAAEIEAVEKKVAAGAGTALAHGAEIVLLLAIFGRLFGVI